MGSFIISFSDLFMTNKVLIIVVVIAGFGLIYFQAEAKALELEKIFSDNSASIAAPEMADLNPKESTGKLLTIDPVARGILRKGECLKFIKKS